jgi:hypothetical protein
MNWSKLFGINKAELHLVTLVEVLASHTIDEIRDAIPKAHEGYHLSANPPKTKPPREKKRKSFTGLKGVFF